MWAEFRRGKILWLQNLLRCGWQRLETLEHIIWMMCKPWPKLGLSKNIWTYYVAEAIWKNVTLMSKPGPKNLGLSNKITTHYISSTIWPWLVPWIQTLGPSCPGAPICDHLVFRNSSQICWQWWRGAMNDDHGAARGMSDRFWVPRENHQLTFLSTWCHQENVWMVLPFQFLIALAWFSSLTTGRQTEDHSQLVDFVLFGGQGLSGRWLSQVAYSWYILKQREDFEAYIRVLPQDSFKVKQ